MGTDFLIQIIVLSNGVQYPPYTWSWSFWDTEVEKSISALFGVSVHPAVIIRSALNEASPRFLHLDFIDFSISSKNFS